MEVSAAIFGTGAKWHLWVSSSRLTVWLIILCVVFFHRSMCWGDQPVEPWLLTLDPSRCLGLELCSFRALLFCLVFDCGMGCKFEGLGTFKTSVNRFLLQGWLPAVSSFSSTVSLSFFLFLGPKIAWGSSDL